MALDTLPPPAGSASHTLPRPDICTTALDVVIPVYSEQAELAAAVRRVHDYLSANLPYRFRITISDNASTDLTPETADRLASVLPGVTALHVAEKGRGLALKQAWSTSDAVVLAYMDVDLSTDLAGLLPLVAPLLSGHSDLAIGTRLHRDSRVVRGAKREVISRCYNLLLRGTLAAHFSDARCGFKAIRGDVARQLLPLVEDTGWFFDTEILVLAERAGLRIHEVPVDWVDDPDSRVDLVATAVDDLKGIARIGRGLASGRVSLALVRAQLGRGPLDPVEAEGVQHGVLRQVVRFGAIGVASTVAYLLLYLVLSGLTGAQVANALALSITAVANTAANRRLTFGLRGQAGAVRQHVQGFGIFLVALVLSSGSLALLHSVAPSASRFSEVFVLVVANLAGTVVRFVLLRSWVFRARPATWT